MSVPTATCAGDTELHQELVLATMQGADYRAMQLAAMQLYKASGSPRHACFAAVALALQVRPFSLAGCTHRT
jgi:hypothetical protein